MSLGFSFYAQNRGELNKDPVSVRQSKSSYDSPFELTLPISEAMANFIGQMSKNIFKSINIAIMFGIFACSVVITASVWDIKNKLA